MASGGGPSAARTVAPWGPPQGGGSAFRVRRKHALDGVARLHSLGPQSHLAPQEDSHFTKRSFFKNGKPPTSPMGWEVSKMLSVCWADLAPLSRRHPSVPAGPLQGSPREPPGRWTGLSVP